MSVPSASVQQVDRSSDDRCCFGTPASGYGRGGPVLSAGRGNGRGRRGGREMKSGFRAGVRRPSPSVDGGVRSRRW
jgi:hypothetical protein